MNGTYGKVIRLWRYPVKSMLGEECAYLDIHERGVAGDRLFAVRDADGKFGSGKTTHRFRKIDGLFGFSATYHQDAPRIIFPNGRPMLGNDSDVHAALSEALGETVTLAREAAISHFDAAPLHLLTTASLAWLRALVRDVELDDRRFRPNIVIDVPGEMQVEQRWLGKTICIGDEVRLRVSNLTERCAMVNLSQADLPDDSRVLRGIGRNTGPHFGVYAEIVLPGRIKRGDCLMVSKLNPADTGSFPIEGKGSVAKPWSSETRHQQLSNCRASCVASLSKAGALLLISSFNFRGAAPSSIFCASPLGLRAAATDPRAGHEAHRR